MQPEQWAHWVEVERRATKMLLMRREEGPLLQILEMPADGDWVCWEFFSGILGHQVYRSTWKRMDDLKKFQSPDYRADHAPAPSLKTRSADCSADFGAATVRELATIRFPILPPYEAADFPGTLVELSVSRPQVNALMRWHDPGPEDWHEIVEWTRRWRTDAAKNFT